GLHGPRAVSIALALARGRAGWLRIGQLSPGGSWSREPQTIYPRPWLYWTARGARDVFLRAAQISCAAEMILAEWASRKGRKGRKAKNFRVLGALCVLCVRLFV